MNSITIRIDGQPVAKQRPRFNMKTGHTYTPSKTRDYEKKVAQSAWVEMAKNKFKMTDRPIHVDMTAAMEIPKSWSKKKKFEAEFGGIHPSRCDLDNVLKSVLDGVEGVVMENDKQVRSFYCKKKYAAPSDGPHVVVSFYWE